MALKRIAFSDLPDFENFTKDTFAIFPPNTTDIENPEIQRAILDRAERWLEMQKDLGEVVKWNKLRIRHVGCLVFVDGEVFIETPEPEKKATERMPFVSSQVNGKKCGICNEPASYKVGEMPGPDDPEPGRKRAVSYICNTHYYLLFRPNLDEDKKAELTVEGLFQALKRMK